jgi:hypothetical protein
VRVLWMLSTTHTVMLRKRGAITHGVSAGPKMLAAHTNMSESLDGDAEQPSCCTGVVGSSPHNMHGLPTPQEPHPTPCRTCVRMQQETLHTLGEFPPLQYRRIGANLAQVGLQAQHGTGSRHRHAGTTAGCCQAQAVTRTLLLLPEVLTPS